MYGEAMGALCRAKKACVNAQGNEDTVENVCQKQSNPMH